MPDVPAFITAFRLRLTAVAAEFAAEYAIGNVVYPSNEAKKPNAAAARR